MTDLNFMHAVAKEQKAQYQDAMARWQAGEALTASRIENGHQRALEGEITGMIPVTHSLAVATLMDEFGYYVVNLGTFEIEAGPYEQMATAEDWAMDPDHQ